MEMKKIKMEKIKMEKIKMEKIRLTINTKLVILGILLILVSGIIFSVVGYSAAEKAIYEGARDRLQGQAEDWRFLVQAYNSEIIAQEKVARQSAKDIVTAQTKMTFELIDEALDENGGALPTVSREDIFTRLNQHTVGETGYIWILDYEGNYVLSKDRIRDGENIWEAKDSEGNMVIQDLVGKGKLVQGSEMVYHSYMWLNEGETEPREKIVAMIHFPEVEWIVGVSTYYDDLVDMNYKENTMNNVKNLIAQQVIGDSGYIWVLDSDGNYVVSKNRLRDGENINNAKDANGVFFVQEAVKRAKGAGTYGSSYLEYPWLNAGEDNTRLKVAGLAYFEEWDWIIGTSAYYDDFDSTGSLATVRNILLIVGLFSIIIGVIAVFIIANHISKPLREMTVVGNKIANGDFNVEIPSVKSNDEIQDIGSTMALLVGALKFYKKQEKDKKK